MNYQERITDEKGDAEEEWQLFKSVVVECQEVCATPNSHNGRTPYFKPLQ